MSIWSGGGGHDKVSAIIHWKLCKKYRFECSDKPYEYTISKGEKILENRKMKTVWDILIQTVITLECNKPDLSLRRKREIFLLPGKIFCSFDIGIEWKDDKIHNCSDLMYEILITKESIYSTTDHWNTGLLYKIHGKIS